MPGCVLFAVVCERLVCLALADARCFVQVHDDVMLEVDEASLPELAALTRAVMVQAGVDAGLRVPLAVRLRHGPNWHNLADMD